MRHLPALIVAAGMAVPALASAHVVFTQTAALPGSNTVYALRIGHGCSGAATTALRVEIPEGIAAKPQAKAGWTVTVERTPLKTPVKGEGGKMVMDRVSAITWTGNLPDDQFDDFGLMLKLPATTGPVYFPAHQTCVTGHADWTDIPAASQAWHDVAHPAPVLNLAPEDGGNASAMGGKDMSHMDH